MLGVAEGVDPSGGLIPSVDATRKPFVVQLGPVPEAPYAQIGEAVALTVILSIASLRLVTEAAFGLAAELFVIQRTAPVAPGNDMFCEKPLPVVPIQPYFD